VIPIKTIDKNQKCHLDCPESESQKVWDLDEVVGQHDAVDEPEAADSEAHQDHVKGQNLGRPSKTNFVVTLITL
jgi:hypothetical protein